MLQQGLIEKSSSLPKETKSLPVDPTLLNLPNPSAEQVEILLAFRQGYNCKIDALAGAGKSTSLLLIASEAKTMFGARILIITYNKDLKNELSGKIRSLGLDTHCEAYTYHGYASRIYKRSIHNDKIMRECLDLPVSATNHDVVLLDEVQDMNQDYHKLVSKILSHGKIVVLVGDKRQCINEYIGATIEYLVNYNRYFDTGRPWKELTLRTSYRLTPSLANFVNKNILCEDIVIAGNTKDADIPPIYSIGTWNIERFVAQSVDTYGPDQVVIMMPSVRNISPKSPVGKLCSKRVRGVLFCVNESDVDDDITRGKVLITSYNSMKGRERKCIIIVGLDESYFEYYDKKWNNRELILPKDTKCLQPVEDPQNLLPREALPNILYVAATRSREQLIIIQDSNKDRLRTITKKNLYDTCEVHGDPDEKPDKNNKIRDKGAKYKIEDLIRHRDATDTIEMLSFIETDPVVPVANALPYQNVIQFNGYYEDMRQYYNILIPLLAQYRKTGEMYFTQYDPDKSDDNVTRYNELLKLTDKTINQWMELVVLFVAIQSNRLFYFYQITNYDWVDSVFVNTQVDRILDFMKTNNRPGTFDAYYSIVYKTITLEGSINCLCMPDDTMIEFRCATHLSDSDKIQCATYISMYYISCNVMPQCKLFNTRTGEIVNVKVTDPNKFLDVLIRRKMK
jgi:thymidine kinase